MDRVQDGEPELLSILLVTGHRHEGDPAILAGSVRPRTQKRGLPASRRRRDDGHLPQGGAIERGQEAIAMKETHGAGDARGSRPGVRRGPRYRRHGDHAKPVLDATVVLESGL